MALGVHRSRVLLVGNIGKVEKLTERAGNEKKLALF